MSRAAEKTSKREHMSLWEKLTFAFYRQRGFLFAPPFIAMLLITWKENEHHWTFVVGALLFLGGFFLRFWSQMHLHYRLKEKKLLTVSGPYVYVRNPIYIGNALLILGTGIMMELIWFIPVLLLYCVLVYTLVVRYEEYHLKMRYGNGYEEFMDRVPRWIPAFSKKPIISPPARRELDALIVPSFLAEYQCFILLALPVLKEAVTDNWLGIVSHLL